MAVPSRRRCTIRNKKRQSVLKFLFKKKYEKKPVLTCEKCKGFKLMHFLCRTCDK